MSYRENVISEHLHILPEKNGKAGKAQVNICSDYQVKPSWKSGKKNRAPKPPNCLVEDELSIIPATTLNTISHGRKTPTPPPRWKKKHLNVSFLAEKADQESKSTFVESGSHTPHVKPNFNINSMTRTDNDLSCTKNMDRNVEEILAISMNKDMIKCNPDNIFNQVIEKKQVENEFLFLNDVDVLSSANDENNVSGVVIIPAPDYETHKISKTPKQDSSNRTKQLFLEYPGEDFSKFLVEDEKKNSNMKNNEHLYNQSHSKATSETNKIPYKKQNVHVHRNKNNDRKYFKMQFSKCNSLRGFSYVDSKCGITNNTNKRRIPFSSLSLEAETEIFIHTSSYEEYLRSRNANGDDETNNDSPPSNSLFTNVSTNTMSIKNTILSTVWEKMSGKFKNKVMSVNLSLHPCVIIDIL